MKRLFVPEPSGLLELWGHEAPRLLRIVSVFEESDLCWAPPSHNRQRPIAEVIQHVEDSLYVTASWLGGDKPQKSANLEASRQIVDRLIAAQAALASALRRSSRHSFENVICPFGVAESIGVAAFGMFKHELHHRGELVGYAKCLGRLVPHLYNDKVPIRTGFTL
jgi:hypothetical protein